MSPSDSSSASSALSHFKFPIDIFEGMHQFHSKFTEGKIFIKQVKLERGVIHEILTELKPFLYFLFA